ncbi:MAG: hypothetical protein ACP5U0_10455 [Caldisphaera sp.]
MFVSLYSSLISALSIIGIWVVPFVIYVISSKDISHAEKTKRYLFIIRSFSTTLNEKINEYKTIRGLYHASFYEISFFLMLFYELKFRPSFDEFIYAILYLEVFLFFYHLYFEYSAIIWNYVLDRKRKKFKFLGFKGDFLHKIVLNILIFIFGIAIYWHSLTNLINLIVLFTAIIAFITFFSISYILLLFLLKKEAPVFEDAVYQYLLKNNIISPLNIIVRTLDGSSISGTLLGIGNAMIIKDDNNITYYIHWPEISYIGMKQ